MPTGSSYGAPAIRYGLTASVCLAVALLLPASGAALDVTGTVIEAGTGKALDGFFVSYAGASVDQRVVVGEDGSFLIDVPQGISELIVSSSTGVRFGTFVAAGGKAAIQVEASGHVFASDNGDPVAGVRLRLLNDGDGSAVGPGSLGPGQQDQLTDKHGLYRFDPAAAGAYRIEVQVDGLSYHFPSLRLPPQAGFAVVGADGKVAGSAAPDPNAPRAYWLRFNGSSAPGNNHIAVDRSGALVAIQKTASKSQAQTGDIITYTVRVENRSSRDFIRTPTGGGVIVRDVMPADLRLLPESARATLNGDPVTLGPVDGLQIINFKVSTSGGPAAFELKRGGHMVIRYQAVVGVTARAGRILTNRAVVVDPGGVSLSDTARADVRLAGDPLFDKSWIRGRVFCDEDGDKWAGGHDPGVYGARVYLDTGRYAVTDSNGRFHLSDVPPGLRVLKIDVNTVPPGSKPVNRISRTLQVSRGIPQQASFGFRCTTAEVGPNQVIPAEKDRPAPPAERLVVTGKLADLSVAADGRTLGAGGAAALKLKSAPAKGLLDVPWTPKGLASPISLGLVTPTTKNTGGTWRLWIEAEHGGDWRPVRVYLGRGAPPTNIDWDGTAADGEVPVSVLGAMHRARFVVADGKGSRWHAPPVYFTVGWGRGGPVTSEVAAGKLFGRRNRPTRGLRRVIGRVSKTLKKLVEGQLLVEIGVAAKATVEQRAQARAQAIAIGRKVLAKAGLASSQLGAVVVNGPSRVELKIYDASRKNPKAGAASAPAAVGPRVFVGGAPVQPDKAGRFLIAPRLPRDGVLVVEITNAAGAVREVRAALGGTRKEAGPGIVAALAEGKLSVAGVAVPVALLGLRVYQPHSRLGLKDGVPETPIAFKLLAPAVPLASWKLKVLGPVGEEVMVREGKGSPPPQVAWADAKGLSAGDYIYVLEAQLESGAAAVSPQRVLELTDAPLGGALGVVIKTLRGKLFTDDRRLRPALQKRLEALAKELSARPETERWLIEVHGDGTGESSTTKASTKMEARRVKNLLVLKGLPQERLTFAGIGNDRAAPGKSRKIKRANRRVEIRQLPTDLDGKPQRAFGLKIDGRDVLLSGRGVAMARLEGEPGTTVQVEVLGRYGQRLTTPVEIPTKTAGKKQDPKAAPFGLHTLHRALAHQKKGKGPPPPLRVADLRVELPPDNTELGQPLLPIRGQAPVGLTVRVNGQKVPTPSGRFELLLPMKNGESSPVVIEAEDQRGNIARVKRTYKVKGNALFLMAIADGSLSQHSTKLDQQVDTLDAGKVLLHGRLALYLKARIKGGDLIKLVKLTAFGDTAQKQDFNNFVDQVIDSERSYPLYGDSGMEVTDAKARGTKYGRYYVAVEAEKSKLIIGTFKAGDWGVELFRYARIMEGAQLRLQQAFHPGYETVVEGFVNYADKRVRRTHATLRGTGGSYYFLPDKDVVEGSDQVSLVVYDRDSGARLQTVAQVRDVDYRIDYLSGRLMFKKSVSSTVDASFLMGSADILSGRLGMDGHAVRILVDYETRASGEVGDTTWGAYAKQTFANLFSLGGGYVQEGRAGGGGPDYELWGVELAVTPTKTTRIEAELAHSTSGNGANLLSDDGGLTFHSIGAEPAIDKKGYGITVRGRTDIGEFLDKERPYLQLSANYQRQDRGFVSSHSVIQQGQERGGAEVRWDIDRRNRLVLRHDTLKALRSDLTFDDGTRLLHRSLTSAQYTHHIDRWTIVGEVLHGLEKDEGEDDDTNRGAIGALVRYRFSQRVALWLEQQLLIGGDDRVLRDTGDHFVTAVGLDVALHSDIALTLGQRVRWSGEDTAVLGLRAKLSDTTTMYVQQRLIHPRDTNRWIPATAMGSEERWGADGLGRSYGEYQVGSSGSGVFNRAVLGIGRRFRVMPGLNADLAFERSHSEGGAGPADTQLPERDSNTLAIGAEFVGHEDFKLSSRFEARFEDADHDRLQLVSFNRLSADLGAGVSLLVRADLAMTQNRDLDAREAESVNLSLGLAYRPLSDAFTVLLRAARIVDMRPSSLDPGAGTLRTTADVVAIEPIIELPLRFQITPKLAYRHAVEEAEGLPEVESHTILAALRLAFHLWETLDIAGEYRWMFVDIAEQMEHGALAEMAVNITRFVRIGAGYNFTYFDDNLFDVNTGNSHGFFVRLTGLY